jgi:beta-glucanase (GH16 family)
MNPDNVKVRDGQLRLRMSPGVLDGAEVRTVAAAPAGVFEARIQLADVPTSVTGVFLYAPPDLAHEIDIELYNQPTGRARFTTYSGGKLTHTAEQALPFDPTADFHLYGIAQTPNGVEFYVDHTLMQAWDGGVPREPMNLYINTWYPQWLAGTPTATEQYTTVDYAAHSDPAAEYGRSSISTGAEHEGSSKYSRLTAQPEAPQQKPGGQ